MKFCISSVPTFVLIEMQVYLNSRNSLNTSHYEFFIFAYDTDSLERDKKVLWNWLNMSSARMMVQTSRLKV